jgi:hypothetical protein
MWFGVAHYSTDEDGVTDDGVILVAYEANRLYSLGVPTRNTPLFIRILREANRGGRPPRCGRCDAPLEELPEQCCERCGERLPGLRTADEHAGKPH